jgi:hypothetical protein
MAHPLVGAGRLERGKGDSRVQLRSNPCGAFAALMLGLTLSSCANTDLFDGNEHWFSRPFDWAGQNGGYTFAELQESSKNRPITANDLVSANGACPPLPAAPMQAAPPPSPVAAGAPGTPGPDQIPAGPPTLLGQGIALGMSECDVVYRAGPPNSVQLGQNGNGDRTLVLSYDSGPRPGIYHFEGGRLMNMDRVDLPPPAPKVAKKVVKKKKPAQQVSTDAPQQVSTK